MLIVYFDVPNPWMAWLIMWAPPDCHIFNIVIVLQENLNEYSLQCINMIVVLVVRFLYDLLDVPVELSNLSPTDILLSTTYMIAMLGSQIAKIWPAGRAVKHDSHRHTIEEYIHDCNARKSDS